MLRSIDHRFMARIPKPTDLRPGTTPHVRLGSMLSKKACFVRSLAIRTALSPSSSRSLPCCTRKTNGTVPLPEPARAGRVPASNVSLLGLGVQDAAELLPFRAVPALQQQLSPVLIDASART